MDVSTWVAIIALALSVLTLILSRGDMAKAITRQRILDLEARVKVLEEEVRECERDRARLIRENTELREMIVQLQREILQLRKLPS